MRIYRLFIVAIVIMGIGMDVKAQVVAKEYKLWYKFSAREWEEALPVGNGRLGGMVFGGIDRERITLNEESIWANGVSKAQASSEYKYLLEEKRRLIFAGKYKEAEDLKQADIRIQ